MSAIDFGLTPTCIINGCILYDADHHRYVNGDLYICKEVFFHFAALHEGKPAWHLNAEPDHGKILRLHPAGRYLIKGDVTIVHTSQATLNYEAWERVTPRYS